MKLLIITVLLCLCVHITHTQSTRSMTPTTNNSDKRLALVIGNSAYKGKPLPNAHNDALDMANQLRVLGFEVILKENLNKEEMENAIADFTRRLKNYGVALFYFAGHGFMSTQKENYLMSVEMRENLTEAFAKEKSISIETLMASMDEAKSPTKLLFLDACRNNPFRGWGRSDQKGLGSVSPPEGMVAFFAASPGQEASENPGKRNGLFTQELLQQLRQPNLELTELIRNTRNQVKLVATDQSPYRVGDLSDVFYFQKTEVKEVTEYKPTTKKYMDLPFAEMAFIKGGTFMMGDTRNEGDDDEKPVHQVTVSDFYMGKYEVTQRQWEDITGTNPSKFKNCSECPVESVSWNDVQEFLRKLNQKTGLNYRLPTEAEWEYAAGGGAENRTRFGNGKDILRPSEANFEGSPDFKKDYSEVEEFRKKTTKVGIFTPNVLGLYDMTGNVLEWCQDWYGTYTAKSQQNPTGAAKGHNHVYRGGGWFSTPEYARAAARSVSHSDFRTPAIGFRVVSSQ
jgi:formylglycine-generating enzyme required for sulfatase activity